MPALVEGEQGQEDRCPSRPLGGFSLGKVVCLPGSPRPAVDGGGIEDLIGGTPEDAIGPASPRPDELLIEEVAEDRQQRNPSASPPLTSARPPPLISGATSQQAPLAIQPSMRELVDGLPTRARRQMPHPRKAGSIPRFFVAGKERIDDLPLAFQARASFFADPFGTSGRLP